MNKVGGSLAIKFSRPGFDWRDHAATETKATQHAYDKVSEELESLLGPGFVGAHAVREKVELVQQTAGLLIRQLRGLDRLEDAETIERQATDLLERTSNATGERFYLFEQDVETVPRPNQSAYAIDKFSDTAMGFIRGFNTKGYEFIKGFQGITAEYDAKEKLPKEQMEKKKLKVFHSLLICGTAAICLLDEKPAKSRRNEFAATFYRELYLVARKAPGTATACRKALVDFLDNYAPPVVVKAIQGKVKQGDEFLDKKISDWRLTRQILGAPSAGSTPDWLGFLQEFCTGHAASFLARLTAPGAEDDRQDDPPSLVLQSFSDAAWDFVRGLHKPEYDFAKGLESLEAINEQFIFEGRETTLTEVLVCSTAAILRLGDRPISQMEFAGKLLGLLRSIGRRFTAAYPEETKAWPGRATEIARCFIKKDVPYSVAMVLETQQEQLKNAALTNAVNDRILIASQSTKAPTCHDFLRRHCTGEAKSSLARLHAPVSRQVEFLHNATPKKKKKTEGDPPPRNPPSVMQIKLEAEPHRAPDLWAGQPSGILRVSDLILPGTPPLPNHLDQEDPIDEGETNPLQPSAHSWPLDLDLYEGGLSWLKGEDQSDPPPEK